jgi:transcription elongation factor Elf1
MLDTTATFTCAVCGQPVVVEVDLSAGRRQQYVEDCEVCCSPNVLTVEFDDKGRAWVSAEQE